jgi:uncharacterized protein YdeI (YjbR/CyaY-like superfamily)
MASEEMAGGVRVPQDLQLALSETPGALEAWNKLTDTEKSGHVSGLESAADAMARVRCVQTLVNELALDRTRR